MQFKCHEGTALYGLPQLQRLPEQWQEQVKTVGTFFSSRLSNYIIHELIDWSAPANDPLFNFYFPGAEFFEPGIYELMQHALITSGSADEIERVSLDVKMRMAGLKNNPLGLVNDLPTTYLLFKNLKNASLYLNGLEDYRLIYGGSEKILKVKFPGRHKQIQQFREANEVTFSEDLLMKYDGTKLGKQLIAELGHANQIETICFSTNLLGYWPYRFISDPDTRSLFRLFDSLNKRKINVRLIFYPKHVNELKSEAVKIAITKLQSFGVEILAQVPLLANINNSSVALKILFNELAALNCTTDYLRMPGYFTPPCFWLENNEAIKTFQSLELQQNNVVGPVIKNVNGDLQLVGNTIDNQEIVLKYLSADNASFIGKTLLAKIPESKSIKN